MIFNIQRYSTHDGPGIRTVVFLKGCSLGCRWCQNPEGKSPKQDLLFDARPCLAGCEICQDAAPDIIKKTATGITIDRKKIHHEQIIALESCCPTLALTVCGKEQSVEDIMAIIRRDRPFYDRSGGGMTLSGGEPFMQVSLARTLLKLSHEEGIHTAVETCLHVPWHHIAPSLPYVDVFLADLKQVDGAIFNKWTQGSARRVLINLRKLAAIHKNIIIRVPVIPGFNDDIQSIKSIIDFSSDETGAKTIHFLPYHTLGINKYVLLDQPYFASKKPLNAPELLTFAQEYAKQKGLTAILRG